jgi:hypothetical protein
MSPRSQGRTTIRVIDIIVDPDVQARVEVPEATIEEYVEAYRSGARFPPVVIFEGPDGKVLSDGFSRVEASKRAGKATIECEFRHGTKRDAMLYACGANADHGLRRTNADKRRAVTRLLEDKEWSKWSDSKIAKLCRVSNHLVAEIRADLTRNSPSDEGTQERTYRTKHGTTAKMRTGKIGKRSKAKPQPKPKTKPKPAETEDEKFERWVEELNDAGAAAHKAGKHVWQFPDDDGTLKWWAILTAPPWDPDGGVPYNFDASGEGGRNHFGPYDTEAEVGSVACPNR